MTAEIPFRIGLVVVIVLTMASQFNLLEMTSSDVTPEDGIGIYEHDRTQGPACAIAAGAGTIFRNDFVDVDGHCGQSSHHQLNCLAGVGQLLGNTNQGLWRILNGYALPSAAGWNEVNRTLSAFDAQATGSSTTDAANRRSKGYTGHTGRGLHTVSQAYCSAVPVAYTSLGSHL